MRIKINTLSIFLLLILSYETYAQESEGIFTIYLVRHAEKEISAANPKDPPLTPCGVKRAESLAVLLNDVVQLFANVRQPQSDGIERGGRHGERVVPILCVMI